MKPVERDDPNTAVWRLLFTFFVNDEFMRWRIQSTDDKRAWIQRYLPGHIVRAIPHLPPDERTAFIVSEVRRRITELGMVHYSPPWAAIKLNAMRKLNGETTKELWDIALPVWVMSAVKRYAGAVTDEGVIARLGAEAKTRAEKPPTKAAIKRAIIAELGRLGTKRRRGRPKKK